MIAAFAVTPVVLVVGLRGVAVMRTISDFLVASRGISPLVNSAAVSGEYLHFRPDTAVVFRMDVTLHVGSGTIIVAQDGSTKPITSGSWHISSGRTIVFAAGTPVPDVPGESPPGSPGWGLPLLDRANTGYPLLTPGRSLSRPCWAR